MTKKSKPRVQHVCQSCGYTSSKWLGRCPECDEWNSFDEETVVPTPQRGTVSAIPVTPPQVLSEIDIAEATRLPTHISEFDRVLGGGVVPGSLVLIGGEPGIGKSTLLLQMAVLMSKGKNTVLYVSGEESSAQIKLRATRMGLNSDSLYVLCETALSVIGNTIEQLKPLLVIIDSVQTVAHPEVSSAPGSITQIRSAATVFLQLAKSKGLPIFLVGHVTKEGSLAGPRVLEHTVDTVLYFEGESQYAVRILRAVKNRFGSTNEIGVFEMRSCGLVEVVNPSERFLSERREDVSGSVVISSIEGTRPLLLELQALVAPANFGSPRWLTTGVEKNRVSLILAVLDKRVGLHIQNSDVFVNIAGGVSVNEPGIDLGVAIAIASNYRDHPVSSGTVVIGEVGLGGEVRAVSQIEKRIHEAAKLGFSRVLFPEQNQKGLEIRDQIEMVSIRDIHTALSLVL